MIPRANSNYFRKQNFVLKTKLPKYGKSFARIRVGYAENVEVFCKSADEEELKSVSGFLMWLMFKYHY